MARPVLISKRQKIISLFDLKIQQKHVAVVAQDTNRVKFPRCCQDKTLLGRSSMRPRNFRKERWLEINCSAAKRMTQFLTRRERERESSSSTIHLRCRWILENSRVSLARAARTRGLWTDANGPVTQFACSIVGYSLLCRVLGFPLNLIHRVFSHPSPFVLFLFRPRACRL